MQYIIFPAAVVFALLLLPNMSVPGALCTLGVIGWGLFSSFTETATEVEEDDEAAE